MKQEISDVHHDKTINWELKDVREQNGKNQQKLTINIVQPGEWHDDQQSAVWCDISSSLHLMINRKLKLTASPFVGVGGGGGGEGGIYNFYNQLISIREGLKIGNYQSFYGPRG